MTATLTFKTNDAMDQLPDCENGCRRSLSDGEENCDCGAVNLRNYVSTKVRYGEYIYVTFDGEAGITSV